MSKLADTLLREAGVKECDHADQTLDMKEQAGKDLFEALLTIFIQKGRLYGNHRFKMPTTPEDYSSKMLFADIERKFRRYQYFTWHENRPEASLILETLGDLIVHSAVAMLVIDERRKN